KDKRLRDIGDARLELEELDAGAGRTGSEEGTAVGAQPPPAWWRASMGAIAIWLGLGAAVATIGLRAWRTAGPAAERPGGGFTIPLSKFRRIAWSSDGANLAYTAWGRGRWGVYIRALSRLDDRPIPGAEEGGPPFFSPDGRWLGFTRLDELRKVPIGGGAPVTVCSGGCGGDFNGNANASWGPDGTIVFQPDGTSGLFRVSAEG